MWDASNCKHAVATEERYPRLDPDRQLHPDPMQQKFAHAIT